MGKTVKQLLKANKELTEKYMKLCEMVINGPVPVSMPMLEPPLRSVAQDGLELLPFPMSISEEEEDALHGFRTGAINKKELEDILAQAEFESVDIDIMP